jgi:hypothetical protein
MTALAVRSAAALHRVGVPVSTSAAARPRG